jgi:hypothetical protein
MIVVACVRLKVGAVVVRHGTRVRLLVTRTRLCAANNRVDFTGERAIA